MKLSRNGSTPLERTLHYLWRSGKSNRFALGLKPSLNILAGFTLVELMIAIAVIAIIAAVGIFTVNQQLPTYRLRSDARTIASTLMMARMKATSSGLQHAIEFDLDSSPQMYRLQHGNANTGSTIWTDETYYRRLSTGVNIASVKDDIATHTSGTARIIYNPNGSSGTGDIRLVLGTITTDGYQILLTPTTGRIRSEKVQNDEWE